jgi:hypothetical protein
VHTLVISDDSELVPIDDRVGSRAEKGHVSYDQIWYGLISADDGAAGDLGYAEDYSEGQLEYC